MAAFSEMVATFPLDDAAFAIVARKVADEWGAQFSDSEHAVFIDLVMDARYHRNRVVLLEAERDRLAAVLRSTHDAYCAEPWTSRGLHAPECLLYEVEP